MIFVIIRVCTRVSGGVIPLWVEELKNVPKIIAFHGAREQHKMSTPHVNCAISFRKRGGYEKWSYTTAAQN